MRIIAISDIHGHSKTFKKIVEDKIQLTKSDKLFLLGDYVHRGPDELGVLDYILQLRENNYQVECLLGNHEMMWVQEHYENRKPILPRHNAFLKTCKTYIEYENFIFVHAGLNFSGEGPFSKENKQYLLWIRDWYRNIDYDWLGERTIIHGHTPTEEYKIRWRVGNYKQAIGIDNGCFIDFISGMRQLCAFDLTNWELHFQKNID